MFFGFNIFYINNEFKEKNAHEFAIPSSMPFDPHSRSTTGVQWTSVLRGFHSNRH